VSQIYCTGINHFFTDELFIGLTGKIVGSHRSGYPVPSSQENRADGGPGSGNNYQGASHGGAGKTNAFKSIVGQGAGYGSYIWPTTMGSSGCCSNGRGGAAIVLEISKTFTHDGQLESKGQVANQDHGSGAGGSILITTPNIHGSGTMNVNGGDAPGNSNGGVRGYGGGGGRIAVHCQSSSWTGQATAYATDGASPGKFYCCVVALLRCCVVVLFRCFVVSLFRCFVVSLFRCFVVSRCNWGHCCD
jgi:hypothetical protein